jgi:uncharacterized membrane protein
VLPSEFLLHITVASLQNTSSAVLRALRAFMATPAAETSLNSFLPLAVIYSTSFHLLHDKDPAVMAIAVSCSGMTWLQDVDSRKHQIDHRVCLP